MKVHRLHRWDLSPADAIALQKQLAGQVETGPPLADAELVAGADVSYKRFSNDFYAGVVVLRASDWSVVERRGARFHSPFPYIPGLLSFREAPALLEAFAAVKSEPDAVMLDGHGMAHPRRFGIACHVGLCLDRPCIGCAKSLFVGTYEEPALAAGSQALLVHREEVIGTVLRTKKGVKPVYVSIGHRIDLESAAELVTSACTRYRLPEPTRQAHLYVNALRRGEAT